ncbi:MAG: tRNA (N(6)-L-threonylcarbamoyladenosine(37)-C(2))-methylthiotransferase MtaB [Lachnospiraceae bacterium]|nr:tRNA (N(6)-L-threonylcarbamoyladenosine(37)-C(2))-methylthiotransferase MtaB [Lachnospiraceae bacterium]
MKKRAALHNLGCKVNAYETEAMARKLADAGYEIVPFDETADVYIVNTCTVTNMADRKSRQMLHRAKEKNSEAVVVAVGCYVQDAADALREDHSVDLLIGNDNKAAVVEVISEFMDEKEGAKKTEMVGSIAASRSYEELGMADAGEHTRAFMKIQDGCNQFCSYCMIPYVRGRVRSRASREILEEAKHLADLGYREVVLTGIHISSYGLDIEAPGENRQTPFADQAETNTYLLEVIRGIAGIEGIERVRLGSLEPGIMTEEFVRAISEIPEICPQFHLSMQSGCDATLERMKRKYRTREYAEKCALLRKYFDNPALTTDIIVGFPGETDEEFAESYSFTESIRFAHTHVFKYSKRTGTAAAAMKEQVPENIKKVRSGRLLELDRKRQEEYAKSCLDREIEVLWEEEKESPDGRILVGHSREYLEVQAPAGSFEPGSLSVCRIRRANPDGTVTL